MNKIRNSYVDEYGYRAIEEALEIVYLKNSMTEKEARDFLIKHNIIKKSSKANVRTELFARVNSRSFYIYNGRNEKLFSLYISGNDNLYIIQEAIKYAKYREDNEQL